MPWMKSPVTTVMELVVMELLAECSTLIKNGIHKVFVKEGHISIFNHSRIRVENAFSCMIQFNHTMVPVYGLKPHCFRPLTYDYWVIIHVNCVQFSAIECPPPLATSSTYMEVTLLTVDARLVYTCKAGYTSDVGTAAVTQTCLENATWSGTPLECQSESCS